MATWWKLQTSLIILIFSICHGLEILKEYQYSYHGSISTGIPEIKKQESKTELLCDVTIEVTKDGHLNVELSNIKYEEFHGITEPCEKGRAPPDSHIVKEGIEELERPFTAYFKNYKGTRLVVSKTQNVWVNNVRKSIISMFQIRPIISPEIYGSKSVFHEFEQTIHGNCESRYILQPIPQYLVEENEKSGSLKVSSKSHTKTSKSGYKSKTKTGKTSHLKEHYDYWNLKRVINFDNCKKLISLQDMTMGIKKPIGTGQTDNIASRSSVSDYQLKRSSSGSFTVEYATQNGSLSINPFGISTEKIIAFTQQSLTLVSVQSNTNRINLQGQTMEIKTNYYEVVSPFARTKEVKEEWIHYLDLKPEEVVVHPELILLGRFYTTAEQIELKNDILNALKRVADILSGPPTLENDDQVANLMEFAKGTSFALPKHILNELFDEIHDGSHPKKDLLQMMIIDVLAGSGSGSAVRVLLKKIEEYYISDFRTISIFMTLTNTLYDVSVIPDLMDFVMKKLLSTSPIVNSNLLINFATIAHQLCLEPNAAERVGGAIFASQTCRPETIIDKFIPYLDQCLRASKLHWEESVIVQALVNLRTPYTLSILEKVALGQISSHMVVRTTAIKGMSHNHLPDTAKEKVMDFLNQVFYNMSEITEVRKVALQSLVTWHPSSEWWYQLAFSTWSSSSSPILRSFVYATIKTASELDEEDCAMQKKITTHALTMARPEVPIKEENIETLNEYGRYINSDFAALLEAGGSFFYNPDSILDFQSSLFSKFNYGGLGLKPFRSDFTVNGMAKLVHQFLGDEPDQQDKKANPRDIFARITSNVYDKIIEHVYEGHENKKSSLKPELHVLLTLYDNIQFIIPLDKDSVHKDDNIDIISLVLQLSMGKEHQVYKYSPLMFIAYAVPSDIGLPLIVQHSYAWSFYEKSYNTLSKSGLEGEIDIRNELQFRTAVSAYVPWSNRIISTAVQANGQEKIPFEYTYKTNVNPTFTVKSLFRNQKVSLVKLIHIPSTFITDIPMKLSNILIPGTIRPILNNYYEDTSCRLKSLTGLDLCTHVSSDGVNWPFSIQNLGQDFRPLISVRYKSLNLILDVNDDVKEFITTVKCKTSTPDETSTSSSQQTGQQNKQSNQDYGSYDYNSLDESPEVVVDYAHLLKGQKTSDRLTSVKNFEFNDGGICQVSLLFNGKITKNHEFAVTKSFHGHQHYKESKIEIFYWNVKDTQFSFCVDIDTRTPSISEMDSLDDVFGREIERVTKIGIGTCSKPEFIFEKKTKMTSRMINYLKCNLKDYSIDEFITEAKYDEAEITISHDSSLFCREPWKSLDDITKRVLNGLLSFSSQCDGAKTKSKDSQQSQNSDVQDQIKIHATSSIPYDTWDADVVQGNTHLKFLRILDNLPLMYKEDTQYYNAVRSHKCIIRQKEIHNFDGRNIKFDPTPCWTVVAHDCSKDNGWVILARSKPQDEVKIVNPTDSVVIEITDGKVVANGKDINPIGAKENIKNKLGKTLGVVTKHNDLFQVKIPGQFRVTQVADKNGKFSVQISVTKDLKNRLCGLCGNFDGQITDADFVGPQKCLYYDHKLFAASWSYQSDEGCDVYTHMDYKSPVYDHQLVCQKLPSYVYSPAVQQKGVQLPDPHILSNNTWVYPVEIFNEDEFNDKACVGHQPIPRYLIPYGHDHVRGTKYREYKCWTNSNVPTDVAAAFDLGYMTEIKTYHSGFNQFIATKYY